MARQISAQTMAANWSKGIAAAGPKWTAGIDNPRSDPNANPSGNSANWQAGVAAAAPTYEAAISSSAYLPAWKAGAKAKVSSFTGSGAARAANFAASAAKLAPMINTAMSGLPAKGPKGTNIQRAVSFATAMHAQKGQARAKA